MQRCNNKLWNYMTKNGLSKVCYICSTDLIKNINYCAGHIHARVHSNDNTLSNLKPLCRTCNGRMGSQHMEEYKYRYDRGYMPSREEYDRNKILYKDRRISSPHSLDLCNERLIGFISKYKCWPRYNDEYDPDEEIKWKNNHVLYLFYYLYLVKERADYVNFLCSRIHFDYKIYRKEMTDTLRLKPEKYNFITSLSRIYNIPINPMIDKSPWMRRRGGNISWNGKRSPLVIYPFIKDKIYVNL